MHKILSSRRVRVFLILASVFLIGGFFVFFDKYGSLSEKKDEGKFSFSTSTESRPRESVSEPPGIINAVYLTSWSAANPKMVDYVIDMAKNTEINAVVIDVKDWSGYLLYDTQVPEAEKYNAERRLIPDIRAFLEKFHKEGIYTIARITVFQDPALAQARPDLAVRQKSDNSLLWLDRSGLAWIDPAAKGSWEYNAAIARDAWNQGFDELNFDYVRFPSDGDTGNIIFPFWKGDSSKSLIIKEFYGYLREKLPEAVLSIDLFGLATVAADLGVGQTIEYAFQYFDFICPMVYPSHYATGFQGYENPAQYPYEVVKYSMENAQTKLNLFNQTERRKAKLRPWLQDFDLGGVYDKEQVRSEINAVSEALGDNFCGFLMWNSNNIYTAEAFLPR